MVLRGQVADPGGRLGELAVGFTDRDGWFQLDVAEPVREQCHGSAAFDGGELLLVPGEHQLAAVPGRVLGERGQVGHGDHGAFVGQDQRAGRDPALGEVGEEPGGVGGDLDSGGA